MSVVNVSAMTSDTEWKTATVLSPFKLYGAGRNPVQYMKRNGTVYLMGVISPASNLSYSQDGRTIFKLPKGYRPTKIWYNICQGSGRTRWLLQVTYDGLVQFARYCDDTAQTATTDSWLPLCFSFPAEQ